jgi:mRNA-degrading endonuclease RelE of RelBE toxin-antitoxin system
MTYAVVQTRRFARAYKKLNPNVAADVDDAVAIVGNPLRKPYLDAAAALLVQPDLRTQDQTMSGEIAAR